MWQPILMLLNLKCWFGLNHFEFIKILYKISEFGNSKNCSLYRETLLG